MIALASDASSNVGDVEVGHVRVPGDSQMAGQEGRREVRDALLVSQGGG